MVAVGRLLLREDRLSWRPLPADPTEPEVCERDSEGGLCPECAECASERGPEGVDAADAPPMDPPERRFDLTS
eukprot:1112501-Prorocentrum_minimum.AAC.2